MIKNIYKNLNKTAFWICLLVSIALIITSFLVPPMGVIHSSVITCVGEIFAFAALSTVIAAIEKDLSAKITKGDTTLEINNDSEEQIDSDI